MAAPLPDATPLRPGLYAALCRLRGPQDICVLNQLRSVVEQARHPACPPERRDGFWWSRRRKAGDVPPLPSVPEFVHER